MGRLHFTPGRYVYVGSAMNGLKSRILRHMNTSQGIHKAIHWHIDYLLKEPDVSISSVYVQPSDERVECALADKVSQRGKTVKGFGCSDCRCVSHLFKVEGCGFLSELGLENWPALDFEGSNS